MITRLSQEQKQELVNRYFAGESVQSIITDAGVARSTMYSWINTYKKESLSVNNIITLREFSAQKRKIAHLVDIINILQSSPCAATAPLQERLSVIEDFSSKYHIHTLCKALNVAKGTYYNHILRNKRDNSQFNQKCEELKPIIQDIYDENKQIFGPTKITSILRERGYHVSEKTVVKLMRQMELYSIRESAKQMYKQNQKRQRKNILNQSFTAEAPNKIWLVM